MALIHPNVFDAVVAIGITDQQGKKKWVGTGFLYGSFIQANDDGKKQYRIFVVTKKHVFRNLDRILIRFNPQNNEKAIDFPISLLKEDKKPKWKGHATPAVDIAVLEINMKVIHDHGARFSFIRSDEHVLTLDEMKETGISEGDGVFALGYPMGILDDDKQYVILRAGAIARIRDSYDMNKADYLCDIFVFPGNSGGPVFIKPSANAITGTKLNNKSAAIGVVRSYIPYRDMAISQQTKRPRITFEENSGLASIIPMDYVNEVIEAIKGVPTNW